MRNKLKQLRETRGLSQNAVAEYAGISRQIYNKYESGDIEPPLKTIRLLCKLYDVSISWLLEVDNDSNSQNTYKISNSPDYVQSSPAYYGTTNYLSQILNLLPKLLYSEKAKLLNSVAQSMTNDVDAGKYAQQLYSSKKRIKETDNISFKTGLQKIKTIADSIDFNFNGIKWTREEMNER